MVTPETTHKLTEDMVLEKVCGKGDSRPQYNIYRSSNGKIMVQGQWAVDFDTVSEAKKYLRDKGMID